MEGLAPACSLSEGHPCFQEGTWELWFFFLGGGRKQLGCSPPPPLGTDGIRGKRVSLPWVNKLQRMWVFFVCVFVLAHTSLMQSSLSDPNYGLEDSLPPPRLA